jgi:hypothetical protein
MRQDVSRYLGDAYRTTLPPRAVAPALSRAQELARQAAIGIGERRMVRESLYRGEVGGRHPGVRTTRLPAMPRAEAEAFLTRLPRGLAEELARLFDAGRA